MSVTRRFLCVSCPVGCALTVEADGTKVLSVEGNTCPRGIPYAESEITNPTRVFTSTVRMINGALPVCPVRSASPVPLDRVFDIARDLACVEVAAPLEIGQTIIADVCETGVDIIASRSMKAR